MSYIQVTDIEITVQLAEQHGARIEIKPQPKDPWEGPVLADLSRSNEFIMRLLMRRISVSCRSDKPFQICATNPKPSLTVSQRTDNSFGIQVIQQITRVSDLV